MEIRYHKPGETTLDNGIHPPVSLIDANGTPVAMNIQLHSEKVILEIRATDDRQDLGMMYELEFDDAFRAAMPEFFIQQIARMAENQYPGQFSDLELTGIF